jgi:cytochrome P450
MTHTLAPRFDPLDPAVLDDPYPAYAELRSAGRVCRSGPGQWAVTRYADVSALLRDPRLGHHFPDAYYKFLLGDGEASSFFRRIIMDRDPPDHTRLRHLMNQSFAPTLIRRLTDHIDELVETLLDRAADRGRFDAVADIAVPLPFLVICELLGVPRDNRDEVWPHVSRLSQAFDTHTPAAERPAIDRAVVWLREYFGVQLEERRGRSGDDFVSHMAAAITGPLAVDRDEIIDNAVFLFFAGFETTTNLIANGCAALLQHPRVWAQLRAAPSLAASAVEEFLRYDAPVQNVSRLVLQPVPIGERTINKDRVLVLLIGSANHDERQFAAPSQLDITRSPNPHLSFAGGIHYCLGATLARLEATAVFSRLARRFRTFEPGGELVRRPSAGLRAYARVPVAAT